MNVELLIGFGIVGIVTTGYIIYKLFQRKYVGLKCGYCGRFFPTQKTREYHIQNEEQK